MSNTFVCPHHGTEIRKDDTRGCKSCHEDLAQTRDVTTMTVAERVAEFRRWMGPMTVPLSAFWPRVDALVGRSVYTHEFAFPDALEAEIKSGDHPTDVEIVMKAKAVMGDKPVAVVHPDGMYEL